MTSDRRVQTSAERLVHLLGDRLDFSDGDRSCSPFFSDIGLGITDAGGIDCLFLHYNRRMATFLDPFLAMPQPVEPHHKTAVEIRQRFSSAAAQIAFCDHNTFVVDCTGLATLDFEPAAHKEFTERRCRQVSDEILIFDGYLPTVDSRDHDETLPFVIGLRVVTGSLRSDPTPDTVTIVANDEGQLVLLFSVRMLEVGHEQVLSRLYGGSTSVDDARQRSMSWWAETLGSFNFGSTDDSEAVLLARAVYTLVGNSSISPGNLRTRVCGFPSRGRYPCAYLWDSCFQSLGVALFNADLAADSLLVFADNMRIDGKLPGFICSTWVNPGQSQPPLMGWAVQQLVQETANEDLAVELLPALKWNTNWWLTQRMTRFGLLAASNGMELGWDDTPRCDQGRIAACDLNTYLLLQIRVCAVFARTSGDDEAAKTLDVLADNFAQRMVDHLFDDESGLFWDLDLDTGEPVRVKTPASFLPLLADVPLADEQRRRAVETYLLNPDCFFGPVPFPVVAYDEPSYASDKWWRGPTWINIAYLMICVLEKLHYREEANVARRRLYDVLIADGNMREHFDSQTGKGLGAYEYGWTAAIYLRLHHELLHAIETGDASS